MTRTRKAFAAAAASAVLLLTLTGCWNGQGATTADQASMNTGNGTVAKMGSTRIENATIVLGPEGSKTATVVMRLLNSGDGDALLSVRDVKAGQAAFITNEKIDIPSGGSVSVGFQSEVYVNLYDFEVDPSGYTNLEFRLEKNGISTLSILSVPAVGYYEGIAPNPATKPLT